ncbi:MAG: hypothetical protein K2Q06_03795, partial [Parvularculaceae bacterium]|nr:hypothetical protein [Parvularculaceae bacterium]
MRGIGRIAAGLAAGAAILLLLLWFARGAIVESAVRGALVRQGFVDPELKVARVDFGRLTIKQLAAGGGATPDLRLEAVDVSFALAEALRGKARRIDLGPGKVVVRRNRDGALSIAGFALKPQTERRALPFDALALRDLDVDFEQNGRLTTRVAGAFDTTKGGSFTLVGAAPRLSAGGVALSGATLTGALTLAPDGVVGVKGKAKGDVALARVGVVRDAALSL